MRRWRWAVRFLWGLLALVTTLHILNVGVFAVLTLTLFPQRETSHLALVGCLVSVFLLALVSDGLVVVTRRLSRHPRAKVGLSLGGICLLGGAASLAGLLGALHLAGVSSLGMTVSGVGLWVASAVLVGLALLGDAFR